MTVYIGQDYSAQVNASNGVSAGNPGVSGDGISWPYDNDPNATKPDPSQFQINWNSNPPPSQDQIEQAYERLVNWLRNNPGCYNGDIMLLQLTMDIGQHLGSLPAGEQVNVMKFISNQLNGTTKYGNQTLLQVIIAMAVQGAAVSQPTLAQGKAAALQFLAQLKGTLDQLQGYGAPFTDMDLTVDGFLPGGPYDINYWCATHFQVSKDPVSGTTNSTWVDDQGNPIADFHAFANMAAFSVGMFINSTDSDSTIDMYYQAQIAQLVAEIHDPMALLAALMNLINERDQNNGQAVNGYGNNLSTLKDANALVQKLLGDISGTPNAADFFATLQQLKTLVEQDPALSSLVTNLESDMGTINNQMGPIGGPEGNDMTWTVTAGYYNFPPDTQITYNGKQITVSGRVYLAGGTIYMDSFNMPESGYTFGQLVAMGNTDAIQGEMTGWSSTVMSNFENGVTGIQTLLNGASPAIQQEVQNTTQTMQAEENFEKQAYQSITDLNNQIMRLIQQVMG